MRVYVDVLMIHALPVTVPFTHIDTQEGKEKLVVLVTGGDISSKNKLHYTTNSLVVADEEVCTLS